MGNQIGTTNCFTPHKRQLKYRSEIIKKQSNESEIQNESIRIPLKFHKGNNVQSVPNLHRVKSNQSSFTIQININVTNQGNVKSVQNIQKQTPKYFRSQKFSKTNDDIVSKSMEFETQENSNKSTSSRKQNAEQIFLKIEELDLPEETSYCDSRVFKTKAN